MILADNRDALQYLGICPALDGALRRLSEGVDDLQPGSRIDLDGDRLWLSCFEYDTIPEEESFYEAHERYGDIHMMIRGSEKVSLARPSQLEEFQRIPENDFAAYRGDADHTVILSPGSFLVVFPGDAHKIKMQIDGPETVRKAVFKFKL